MTKSEYCALTQKYGMAILTHPITRQHWGHCLDTDQYIDELDTMTDVDISPVVCLRENLGFVRYTLIAPENWFDLWGLKD